MNTSRIAAATAALTLSLTLAACGGGGGGGGTSTGTPPPSGGTPPPPSANVVTVVGQITGFGSIFVNGVEFETNDARIEVDDTPGFDDSDLSVGMVVKVRGSVNDDGVSGQADDVSYDAEVKGPVANLAVDPTDDTIKNFTLFGVQVVADDNRTVFRAEDDPGFGFDTLADGDHVEVSGFFDSSRLVATYIKKEDANDDDFEVKGTVSNANGDQFTLTLADGSELNVTLAAGAQIPAAGVQDGQFVEVEGTLPDPQGAPSDLLATKVRLEDEDRFDDGDEGEVEIEGVLSHDAGNGWSVAGQTLTFRAGTEYHPASLRDGIADGSAAGLWVKAEGDFQDNTFRVREMEIEGADDGPDGDLEIRGLVQAVDPAGATRTGTLTIGFPPLSETIEVEVNEATMLADDSSLDPFDLTDLSPGSSFLKVRARRDAAGDLVAARLEQEDGSRYEIDAPADDFQAGVSVTVLGVVFGIDAGTEFGAGTPAAGDSVEVRDDDRDGIADEIDLDSED